MPASTHVFPPVTRWVTLPPWLADEGEEACFDAGAPSNDALVGMLLKDLSRGHLNLAMRHFLMLRACGGRVPALIERSCQELLRACPPRKHAEITRQVESWSEMVMGRPTPS